MSQYRRSPPVSPKTQGGESGDMEFVYPLYHVFYMG